MDGKGAPTPPLQSANPSRPVSARASDDAVAPVPKPMLAFHFLRALSRVHGGPTRRRTRTIRRAAYASMARATGSRRAWSRALLRQAQARRSVTLASRRTAVLVRRRVVATVGPAPPPPAPPPPAPARAAPRSNSVATSAAAASRAALPPPPPLPAPRHAGEPARSDALRRLVPGGAGMEYCSLLEETADYVRCLRAQVQLMQGLADLFACQ